MSVATIEGHKIKLDRAPLVYVIGQLKFSAIVSISRFIPEIQEKLRHSGFPRFRQDQFLEFKADPNIGARFDTTDRFEFQTTDADTGIVLAPHFISVHTNRYEEFESFRSLFDTALRTVHEAANFGLSERVGLRFVNLVRPDAAESLSDYIHVGLLGIDPSGLVNGGWQIQSQYTGVSQTGMITVKYSQAPGGSFLPQDLLPNSLAYDVPANTSETRSILDIDHYVERSAPFELQSIITVFESLHKSIDEAFLRAVTRPALERWGLRYLT